MKLSMEDRQLLDELCRQSNVSLTKVSKPVIKLGEPHLKVGFRSMERTVDYFLWIIIPMGHAADITNGMTQL